MNRALYRGDAADLLEQRKITLHQGDIESMFVDSMRENGVEVERPRQPSSLVMSNDEEVLEAQDSYPIKVRSCHCHKRAFH